MFGLLKGFVEDFKAGASGMPSKKTSTPVKSKNPRPLEVQKVDITESPFYPIYDVGTAFSYVQVKFDGTNINIGLKTKTVQESKFALEEVDLLKKQIQSIKKETNLHISELRLAHANRVANRSALPPGGGKIGTYFRYLERTTRASQRGSVSSTIKGVKDSIIKPLDQLLLHCDKMKMMLKKEIIAGKVG